MVAHGRPWPTQRSLNWVWDTGLLDWRPETQPTGGGGGAVTLADGADTTEGTIADAAVTGDSPGTVNAHLRGVTKDLGDPTDAEATGNGSVIAILKRIRTLLASPITVSGPLTDAQLRASPVPISGTVTANAGTNLNTSALALEATQSAQSTLIGAVTETAPATDTASSGLNGRLQRIAQRITSLIALFPAALGAGGGLKVDGSGTALPVSGTVTATGPLTDTQLRAAAVPVLQNLSLPAHDYVSLTYTGANLTTVVFKTGGSGGATVATLTLAYSGAVLTSVTKT